MGRRDDARVFGKLFDRGRRRLDAVLGVKKKQRGSRASLDKVDTRSVDDKRLRLTR
jgi:hypothetical protein